ncbi:MAG: helix-turn-helix transcriptional regulator [Pseudomonadota bacterium]
MSKTKSVAKKAGGNVFADLGVPDPDTHLIKAQLVSRVREIVQDRKLTQARAADLMGVSQPDVSRMFRGQFRDLSVERLMVLLTRLGCEVDIVVKPNKKRAFAAIHLDAA